MSEKKDLEVVDSWFNALNAHDLEQMAHYLDDEHIVHLGINSITGKDASLGAWRVFFHSCPDLRLEVEQTLHVDDCVVSRWRMKGTHKETLQLGKLAEIKPSNQRFEIAGCSITELKNNKMKQSWVYWDTGQLVSQIAKI
jgi:predicted ester cyclase